MKKLSLLGLLLLLASCDCNTVQSGFECFPVGNTTICEPKYTCEENIKNEQ